ncbi:MAG: hypothetical protein HRU09_04445 [Oligoflexales bacterium]|nr:hypothetical protein [Oligoflexales bacterium]
MKTHTIKLLLSLALIISSVTSAYGADESNENNSPYNNNQRTATQEIDLERQAQDYRVNQKFPQSSTILNSSSI